MKRDRRAKNPSRSSNPSWPMEGGQSHPHRSALYETISRDQSGDYPSLTGVSGTRDTYPVEVSGSLRSLQAEVVHEVRGRELGES